MATETRVVNMPTFHEGVLYPAGALIELDLASLGGERKPGETDEADPGNTANLASRDTKPVVPAPAAHVLNGLLPEDMAERAAMKEQLEMLAATVKALTGGSVGTIEEEPATPAVFDPKAVVVGGIPEVIGRLAGLTLEQIDQVKGAEEVGQNRPKVLAALNARLAD